MLRIIVLMLLAVTNGTFAHGAASGKLLRSIPGHMRGQPAEDAPPRFRLDPMQIKRIGGVTDAESREFSARIAAMRQFLGTLPDVSAPRPPECSDVYTNTESARNIDTGSVAASSVIGFMTAQEGKPCPKLLDGGGKRPVLHHSGVSARTGRVSPAPRPADVLSLRAWQRAAAGAGHQGRVSARVGKRHATGKPNPGVLLSTPSPVDVESILVATVTGRTVGASVEAHQHKERALRNFDFAGLARVLTR